MLVSTSAPLQGAEDNNKPYDLAVVIGRFQLPHAGHALLFRKAFSVARNVLVIKGSSFQPRTVKDPFTFEELKTVLEAYMRSISGKAAFKIRASTDNPYSDDSWLKQVQGIIDIHARESVMEKGWKDDAVPRIPKVCIVGHKKDESSFYLDMFPQYDFINVDEFKLKLDSTSLREILYTNPEVLFNVGNHLVLDTMIPFLRNFVKTQEYQNLVRDFKYYLDYWVEWGDGPFLTGDAVIVKAGHILLVQRGEFPGEGQWALPGGFVNRKERMFDAVIREAYEETNIDVPPGLLRGSVVKKELFDHPNRSIRGRIATLACLFKLDGHDKKPGLPKVRAADDAKVTKWFPINDVLKMREVMFEDHLPIITNLLGIEQ